VAEKSEDLITKLAPVEFDASAKAPKFMKFLKQILVEDELIAFVQRFLGYSLTASTEERTMAVLHGVGKTAKVLWSNFSKTSWATTALWRTPTPSCAKSTRTLRLNTNSPCSRAFGFVGVSETKRRVELEESVVKQITGNDTISARAPYGQPFSYRPQFKI
jgi:putative DNA primase/helicase